MTSAQTGPDSFVEVHDEPLHRYLFQNRYIYLYDVLIPVGEITLYHRHAEDTLYVAISDTRVRNQLWGQEPTLAQGLGGRGLCQEHRDRPMIHRIENIGERDVRLIGAEARASPPIVSPEPLAAPGHAPLWEKARLRAYQMSLEPGEHLEVAYGFSGLMVFFASCCLEFGEPGAARTAAFSAGDWIWHDGPIRRRLRNVGPAPLSALLAEWR